MIHIPDILQTLAEIIVALAGFMGVIVVFGSRGVSGEELFYRIRWTFLHCMVAVIAILLPYVLIGFASTSQIVWGIPLIFFGLANCGVLILGMYGIGSGPVESVSKTYISTYALLFVSITVTVLLLLSGFNILVPQIPEMLILGAIWSMCMGGYGFISSIKRGLQE